MTPVKDNPVPSPESHARQEVYSGDAEVIYFSKPKFMIGCLVASIAILAAGRYIHIPTWVVALEVLCTILSLFIFGSMKYQLDKNALTYGAVMVVTASFWNNWWAQSGLKQFIGAGDSASIWHFFHHYFLTLHGLDELVHADTMLFILGLTLFVCVIAQTRILESASFAILKKNKGNIVPTLAILTAIVSLASGVLDGVSMIGLMIRTMVIILFLAKTKDDAVIYAVIVSTLVTTVCGMWLAYGEPPNLIMKANLHPHLDNAFFLRYCLPVAIGSYFIVLWNVKKKLAGRKVEVEKLDVLDLHTADVRFLQASKHGEVLTPIEYAEAHGDELGSHTHAIVKRLHAGEPLGSAMVKEGVSDKVRKDLLGHYTASELAEALDEHYVHAAQGKDDHLSKSAKKIETILDRISLQRKKSQMIGGLSFIPFVGLLIWHAVDHNVPLLFASFAGFAVAFFGIYSIPKTRKLALHEAAHEFKEYLFLLPLFFSIAMLQKTGFFGTLADLMHRGIEVMGAPHVAYLQFTGATFLSAILDNNIVADFASRALTGLDIGVLHLFSMAQIAGYATGGCWTHIGSAQSVVAYSFIKKEVNERYTPFDWIRAITPIILQIFILMTLVVYGEGFLMHFFEGN